MRELSKSNDGGDRRSVAVRVCEYCGAALHPFYYFCTHCATPCRPVASVIEPARPAPLTEGESIRRRAPMAATLFWTYFCVILFGGLVSAAAFQEDRPDLMLFLQTGMVFLTTCVFSTVYWRSLLPQFLRLGFDKPAAWSSLLLLAPVLGVNFAYTSFLQRLYDIPHALPLDRLRETGISEATLVVVFCLYPAVTEEVAFRGLLQHWLQAALRPWRAIGLAAFLFAVVHFSLPSFPYLFGVGCLLGWVKWKTGSLYPAMLIHLLHNLVVIEIF
ncbi:MAG: type II CAAX endopeptidase family protein [Planctomycetaceae bacterium]